MIKLTALTKEYSNTRAVDDLNLEIKPGEIFGFLGPNGAGKTTTIKMMTGLLKPTSGSVEIFGFDIARQPLEAKRSFGFVPDEPFLYEKLTGREFIDFIASIYQVPKEERFARGQDLLSKLDLATVADDLIQTYSHGMKQKVAMAAALVHDPKILILDEPMTGLDPKSVHFIKELMKEKAAGGKIIFFSSHILDVVEKLCSRVGIINKGKLIQEGSLEALKEQKQESLEEIFLQLTE